VCECIALKRLRVFGCSPCGRFRLLPARFSLFCHSCLVPAALQCPALTFAVVVCLCPSVFFSFLVPFIASVAVPSPSSSSSSLDCAVVGSCTASTSAFLCLLLPPDAISVTLTQLSFSSQVKRREDSQIEKSFWCQSSLQSVFRAVGSAQLTP
jgi:hypothetical protein